ncbi:piggyBac transposable element-derived protein 4-like [Acanthaster planci]|uniref:PiggyBac transposable element-derived protein 4-like n=1 Tax=Acanthaster planci TaxID=133434 RepID=A0A8B7ZX90_ACAPL|nr:piggyBac transposable element-derived protein 4-like [Acanthaster planci]
MTNAILLHTNEEGLRQRGIAWKDLVAMKVSSAIGLLLFLGLTKSGRENVRSIWRKGPCARNICLATMSGTRFQDILVMLRFDDKTTRNRQNDKFAPIRDIFDQFAASCRRYYSAGENVPVDKQLVPFRGRCPFLQYMPSKPAKYGIKFWLCVDVDTHYTLNIFLYLGKQRDQTTDNRGAEVVKKLMEPLYNTGRNVTCDNYFTRSRLAIELLQKGLTLVGTIKPNRWEVPQEICPNRVKKRDAKSSVFLFNGDLTLVSYIPKPKRSVILLSSMHHDKSVDGINQKPEIINFYNKTKGGVDTLDQMVSLYSVLRTTKRWPLTVFYNMINIVALNAYILYCQLNLDWARRHTRRDFYEELIMALVRPQIELRAANPVGLHTHTVSAIGILGFNVVRQRELERQHHLNAPLRRDCYLCPSRSQGDHAPRTDFSPTYNTWKPS